MKRLITRRNTRRVGFTRTPGIGATVVVTTIALAVAVALAVAATADAATPTNPPVGASGSVAALNGSSMEVQNQSSGQTTVSWTALTQFSKTVTESVSSIGVGDCVTATGTAAKNSKSTIAARSITVTTPNGSGSCTGTRTGANGGTPGGGFRQGTGGGGFFQRNGGGGSRPSVPGGGAGGNFRTALRSLAIASGKVTAVHGTTLTVSGFDLSPGSFPRANRSNSSKSSKNTRPTQPQTETLKVTTSSSTPVRTTQTAAASDLAVGDCVSAFGPAASNGAVTATTVRITSTGGGSCTGGFPGGGGAFFGGGGGGGGGPVLVPGGGGA
jgi:hypothetical protein